MSWTGVQVLSCTRSAVWGELPKLLEPFSDLSTGVNNLLLVWWVYRKLNGKKKSNILKTMKCGTNNISHTFYKFFFLGTKTFNKKFLCEIAVPKIDKEGLWLMQSHLRPQVAFDVPSRKPPGTEYYLKTLVYY